MLTPNDLSNILRPAFANGLYQMNARAVAAMRACGVRRQEISVAVCHPSSYVLTDVTIAPQMYGEFGIIVCPHMDPTLRVVLWLRDDPRDPPRWIEVVDLSRD